MAIEDDPYWLARMSMSSSDLATIRAKAEQRVRDAYNAATQAISTGEDTARGLVSGAETGVDKFKVGVQAHIDNLLRGGADIGAQMGAQVTRGQDFERRMDRAAALQALDRSVASQEQGLGLGTQEDPGPGQLLREWRTGRGPQTRDLPPSSTFSRTFAAAPSVRAHVQDAVDDWRGRPGGLDANGGSYTGYRGTWGLNQMRADAELNPQHPLVLGNPATNVIGTYVLDGSRNGDRLEWVAHNDMGLHSFFEGRLADQANKAMFNSAPVVPSVRNSSRPQPFGTTRQHIHFVRP